MKLKFKLTINLIGKWILLPGILGLLGCGKATPTTPPSASCPTLTGTPWTPNVSAASASKHNASVQLTQQVISTSGPLVGLAQAVTTGSPLVTVNNIDMSTALGTGGSLTLMAQVTGFPSSLKGSAFAYLVSLKDTNGREWINLPGACSTGGLYTCSGSSCFLNTSCSPTWPSAYFNREQLEEHQGYPSVNIFPTCNWTGGSTSDVTQPACAFNSTFFDTSAGNQLPFGGNYTAQYLIVADNYSQVGSHTVGLTVTAIKKKNNSGTGGALDLNFIIVGSDNVNASRTAKGKQNLNSLATALSNYYGQSNVGIGIGSVNAYEYPCDTGGNTYQSVLISQLGDLFSTSKILVPPAMATKAINIFLVSTITDDSDPNSNFTTLGVDGAIGGPLLLGTPSSGFVVATFDKLDQYNPQCTGGDSICTQQDASFVLLGTTLAHEGGHFLNLNHLSEGDGSTHDVIYDTPVCTATESLGGSQVITVNSCRNDTSTAHPYPPSGLTCKQTCTSSYSPSLGVFCPTALECEFNFIMFWMANNYNANTKTGDGNLFSVGQGKIMNYHPLVQ